MLNVLSALKVAILMLDFSRAFNTQRAMGLGETGLCGSTYLMKKEDSCFSINAEVLPKNKLISQTIHKYLSAGYAENSKGSC